MQIQPKFSAVSVRLLNIPGKDVHAQRRVVFLLEPRVGNRGRILSFDNQSLVGANPLCTTYSKRAEVLARNGAKIARLSDKCRLRALESLIRHIPCEDANKMEIKKLLGTGKMTIDHCGKNITFTITA